MKTKVILIPDQEGEYEDKKGNRFRLETVPAAAQVFSKRAIVEDSDEDDEIAEDSAVKKHKLKVKDPAKLAEKKERRAERKDEEKLNPEERKAKWEAKRVRQEAKQKERAEKAEKEKGTQPE